MIIFIRGHLFVSLVLLTVLTAACAKPIDYTVPAGMRPSSSKSSSSLSQEEKVRRWMNHFELDLKPGDSLYGLTITSFDPPNIHLQGETPIRGTLEWQMYYEGDPELYFIPDVTVPEKFEREFIVVNSDILPVRQGAKVRAIVDDMVVVFMESNKPSTIRLRTIEIEGEPYEAISEGSEEWQYYLKTSSEQQ